MDKPLSPVHLIPKAPEVSPNSANQSQASASKEVQPSKIVPSAVGTTEQSASLGSTQSPDPEPLAVNAAAESNSSMAATDSPRSEEVKSAREVSVAKEEDDDELKRIDQIEGEMKQCEKEITATKTECRELINLLDQMSKEMDNLDSMLSKVELSLDTKCAARKKAMEQLDKTQFQDIFDAGERVGKIEDVARDVHVQVDDMTAETDLFLWYLYNPVYASLDLLLHVSIALILFVVKLISSRAGYRCQNSNATVDMEPVQVDLSSPTRTSGDKDAERTPTTEQRNIKDSKKLK
uniref:Transmembrane protein n=1 Tax=Steinernema glaseri TaxID=37863 RepID=A0A1I7YME5_9BILA